MEKRCSGCGVVKSVDAFGPAQNGAKQSRCRDCRNEWKRSRPASVKAAERNSERQRNAERNRAQRAVKKAVARGTLVRPDACEACGAVGVVQAHHDDYSLRFEVRWLCVRCHADTHMARVRVDLRLPRELVEAVDEARGDVTRTRWIERALEQALSEASRSLRGEHESAGTPDARPSGQGDNPPAPARASEPSPLDPGRASSSEEMAEAVARGADGLRVLAGRFKAPCCDFSAPSPSAVCPAHGRKVRSV